METSPVVKLTFFGEPRTKKNSAQLFGRGARPVILPSREYLDWLDLQLAEKAMIKEDLGDFIPIQGPVVIELRVFRKRNSGDLTGFVEAVQDAIQSDVWQCGRDTYKMVEAFKRNKKTGAKIPVLVKRFDCHKKFVSDDPIRICPNCKYPKMRQSRKGLGIVVDDSQIVEAHLFNDIDKKNPRIEFAISKVLSRKLGFFDLPAEEEEEEEEEDDADEA